MKYTGIIAGDAFLLICILCLIFVGYEIYDLYASILSIGD